MVTRERAAWITAAEVSVLGLVLFTDPGTLTRLFIGLPLLVHLGYRAITSLPMGAVPGRPPGRPKRHHYDLRSRVVTFLNEVRRAEDHVEHAKVAGWPETDVEESLRSARRRIMAAAVQVTKQTGQPQA